MLPSVGRDVHVGEGELGATRKRSPFPCQLSRTNRTVLKTAVTEVGLGCPQRTTSS